MINRLGKLEIERITHNLIIGTYKKLSNIIFDGKRLKTFSPSLRLRKGCPLFIPTQYYARATDWKRRNSQTT